MGYGRPIFYWARTELQQASLSTRFECTACESLRRGIESKLRRSVYFLVRRRTGRLRVVGSWIHAEVWAMEEGQALDGEEHLGSEWVLWVRRSLNSPAALGPEDPPPYRTHFQGPLVSPRLPSLAMTPTNPLQQERESSFLSSVPSSPPKQPTPNDLPPTKQQHWPRSTCVRRG